MNTVTHFDNIAEKYRDVRTTDPEPILYIAKELQGLSGVVAADVGCGAGRYDLGLLQKLGDNLGCLYCMDSSQEMLRELRSYLTQNAVGNFRVVQSAAEETPLRDETLDFVLTFNAIHHFRIEDFLNESSRVLKDGGYLFIPEQEVKIRGMFGEDIFHCLQKKKLGFMN